MQRNRGQLIIIAMLMLLCGCEGTTFRSSVPTYPVRIGIDTRVGVFVSFVPENTHDYITITRQEGYRYHDYTQPLLATDMIGYGGVLVYIDGGGKYNAFDMCCPHCLNQHIPVEIDGFFAVCPICEEEYDLSWGYALPTKGISKESLRRYPIMNSNGKLTITQ